MSEVSNRTQASEASSAPVEKPQSPVRLIVLLSILAVVLGAFLYDVFVMHAAVEAAEKRLEEVNDKFAKQAINAKEKAWVDHEMVQQTIGFKPSTSSTESGHLEERYRWWAPIPLNRRSIYVVYEDAEGTKIQKHEVANDPLIPTKEPEPEAYPAQPLPDATNPDGNVEGGNAGSGKGPPGPGGNGPGMSGPGGKERAPGEGKTGDPPSTESTPDPSTPEKPAPDKSSEEKEPAPSTEKEADPASTEGDAVEEK